MLGLADRIGAALARRGAEERFSADTWLSSFLMPAMEQFAYGGNRYSLNMTNSAVNIHEIANSLPGYTTAVQACPPAFAAELVRASVIAGARFTFRTRRSSGKPLRTFGTAALAPLERPWTNATTGELLGRMEWHAGLAGNAYVTNRSKGRLRVLRPDWVALVYGSDQDPEQAAYALDGELLGYVYAIGGLVSTGEALAPVMGQQMYTLLPHEVAHWSPIPDPEASGIGMSWLTPAVRDMQADRAATEHKLRFFSQGATPNLVVKGLQAATREKFLEIVDMLEERHSGVANAFKTLYLTEGADATVVGSNFKDMDLKNIQGASETRISALSRVPASLLGIAEGLAGSSLNAGNFGMARRIFADTWVYPSLQDLSSSLAPMVRVPSDADLWFETGDMPLLREDGKDAADIEDIKATTVTKYVREGFTAESAIDAVHRQDITLLKHTGKVSVQLQEPGATPGPPAAGPRAPAPKPTAPPPTPSSRSADLDELDDEWDDEVAAIVTAMAVVAGEDDDEERAWNAVQAAKHARYPKGHPKAGKFRPMVDILVDALTAHINSGGKGDPFKAFDREPLRKAALARGITVPRGTSRDDIVKALVASLAAKTPPPKSANAPSPVKATPASSRPKTAAPAKAAAATQPLVTTTKIKGVGTGAAGRGNDVAVHVNGTHVGDVLQSSTGSYFAYTVPLAVAVPIGPFTKRKDAIDALAKGQVNPQVQGAPIPHLPPAAGSPTSSIPGVTLTARKQIFAGNPTPYHVKYKGVDIGHVHGDDNDPNVPWTPFKPTNAAWNLLNGGGKPTRDDAVKELVDSYNASVGVTSLSSTWGQIKESPFAGGAFGNYKTSLAIDIGNTHIGAIHEEKDGSWTAVVSGGSGRALYFKVPPKGASKQQALQALVDAEDGYQKAASTGQAVPSTPAPGPSPTAAASSDPDIQAAIDILYGKDPRGHTMARQLAVYGKLRRAQYDQLGPAEQSTLLGDLAFIAGTSKGKSATFATNTLHRFAPPGTTPGSVPKQAIHLPPDVVSAQTRVADPAGTAGLLSLRPKAQRGQSGDGWTRKANGGTGPWGQYGAAGLMLRHVDDNGVERFLMVERGPRISDPGKWQFPGGAKEEKETFFEGAAREVVEELGFKASDLDDARVHGTHTNEVPSVTVPGLSGGTVPWAYVSIGATVPKQLLPDLSTAHARAETSDAKWMTRAEIAKLNTDGKLLKPLAGGAIEQNVLSLFPPTKAASAAAAGKRPKRLTGTPTLAKPAQPYKQSIARDLVSDPTTKDKLRQDVKHDRKNYAGKVADDRLASIGAQQGFDRTPTVVTKAEMDRLLATGDYIEAWRGVKGAGGSWRAGRGGTISNSKTAKQIQEEFRSGPAYYGIGMYGNGYYFATERRVAVGYSDATPGSLVRVLIPKVAKKIDHSKIQREAHANNARTSQAKGNKYEDGTLWDEGRYAAAKGIDMIEIPYSGANSHVASPGKPAFNVLNRSILIVQEDK